MQSPPYAISSAYRFAELSCADRQEINALKDAFTNPGHVEYISMELLWLCMKDAPYGPQASVANIRERATNVDENFICRFVTDVWECVAGNPDRDLNIHIPTDVLTRLKFLHLRAYPFSSEMRMNAASSSRTTNATFKNISSLEVCRTLQRFWQRLSQKNMFDRPFSTDGSALRADDVIQGLNRSNLDGPRDICDDIWRTLLRSQQLESEPEYEAFIRKVVRPLWTRHSGSLTVDSQPTLKEHAGFPNVRPDAAVFQAVNRHSVPPDDAGQRGCALTLEIKRPDTSAVGVPSKERATATHEDIVAGLQSYKDHIERGELVKHDSITQALTQMAAGRASLGVLLCAQYIVLLAIVVDRHAKGVHIVAFPSPSMCRPGQGDVPPYQVLLEAIQQVQYLKRPDPDCYKGIMEAGKREILVKGLTDAGGTGEAGDDPDFPHETPSSGDDTHDRSRPLEAEDPPRQTGASSSGGQQAFKDDRSVERDTHTKQEQWSIDLKHRSFLDMIYFGHPKVMLCHGRHGELAAVKIAVDEEGSASLYTEFDAYTALVSLWGTIVPRMYAKCKVWLPTAAQWHVPCIVLQWMGFENGDNLSDEERSKPELQERIMHLHRECARHGVVQNDPAWRNIGVVKKDGEIDQVYLYDFGLCILKANEDQIQAGLAAVSRALFGRSADGSEHTGV